MRPKNKMAYFRMKSTNILLCTVLAFFLVTYFSSAQSAIEKNPIIPAPQTIVKTEGNFEVSSATQLVITNEELLPLANLFNHQLRKINGLELRVIKEEISGNHIYFKLDKSLGEETYRLNISNTVTLTASGYSGFARALASLTQLVALNADKVQLPYVSITDKPDYEYRSVLLDLARFWHPVETIQETLDLLWLYKIKFLVLHLSDNRRITFPMDDFPKLRALNKEGQRRYYTAEELQFLVDYAKNRGIAIIPSIDLPGHSQQLWEKYPEVFGSIDPKTGKATSLYVVNMAQEKTYTACEKIIGELANLFYTSPYIHLGGDEVYLEALKELPEYKTYTKTNGLDVAFNGDANELYCHFINRMHKVIKETGKKTLIWEGFHGTGAGSETISKDIEVIVWNTTYNNPKDLISNGYKVINSTWIPWYMVGAMNLAPAQEKGYHWDVNQWAHWDADIPPTEVAKSPAIIGGQISFWEQNYYQVIPILRKRVPALSERLWNNKATSDYKEFGRRYHQNNALYTKLYHPIEIKLDSLLHTEDLRFADVMKVNLTNTSEGKMRYVYTKDWGIPDMAKASVYTNPFTINESGVLTAQLYDAENKEIGFPIQRYYQKIEPAYRYKAYGPAPNTGWPQMPDFTKLSVLREGFTGKMTPERLEKINGELFAKVNDAGHIDTRFNGLYNQYAVELKGTIAISKDDKYILRIQTHDGLAELYIDDKPLAKGKKFENEPEDFTVGLTVGKHNFTIKYYYRQIQNHMSILYKTTAMPNFEPFENLVLPLRMQH